MPNQTQIREFRPPDTDEINTILTNQYPWTEYQTEFSVSADEVISTGDCSVIEVEGQVAGFAWYMEEGAFGRSGYVKSLGIREKYQDMGAGRQIMNYVERELGNTSPDVFLLVSAFNERAQRFYECRGYTRIGKISDYVEPGIDELLFRYQ